MSAYVSIRQHTSAYVSIRQQYTNTYICAHNATHTYLYTVYTYMYVTYPFTLVLAYRVSEIPMHISVVSDTPALTADIHVSSA
jgi:hypothetical protein